MKLRFFVEEAYDYLLNSVDSIHDHYMTQDRWVDNYLKDFEPYYRESSVEVVRPNLDCLDDVSSDEGKIREDLVNVRLLYDSFKRLSPFQATNKFMWTFLSHVDFRDYVTHRWLSDDVRKNTVRTRFFVTNNASSLFDNAISRLWWYAHLTYDEAKKNPYELTEVLLTNQTICTDFVEAKYSRNPTIAWGVLRAVRSFKNMLSPTEGITEYFRAFNKYLNRFGAVAVTDSLSSIEIENMALGYMTQIRKRAKSAK